MLYGEGSAAGLDGSHMPDNFCMLDTYRQSKGLECAKEGSLDRLERAPRPMCCCSCWSRTAGRSR